MDQCSGPNDAIHSHNALRHHCGADADQGTRANGDVTAQMNAGSNMSVITDLIVMIDGAACIENHVVADVSPRVDDDAGGDDSSHANGGVTCNNAAGVDGSREDFSLT